MLTLFHEIQQHMLSYFVISLHQQPMTTKTPYSLDVIIKSLSHLLSHLLQLALDCSVSQTYTNAQAKLFPLQRPS